MNSSKAEAENIEPSAGKEMLDKYWAEIKNEIDDINIVSTRIFFFSKLTSVFLFLIIRWNFVQLIFHWLVLKKL
jgi:hypothetical protein